MSPRRLATAQAELAIASILLELEQSEGVQTQAVTPSRWRDSNGIGYAVRIRDANGLERGNASTTEPISDTRKPLNTKADTG